MKTSAVCFVCGSRGAGNLLYVKPRERGSYFSFLETHETPKGAKVPNGDGVVSACLVCYAFLNQQWDSFERTKTPLVKRLYWLKRVDNRSFTGAEMNVQGEYVAQIMGVQYNCNGGLSGNASPFDYGSHTGISCNVRSAVVPSPSCDDSCNVSPPPSLSVEDGCDPIGVLDLSFSPNKPRSSRSRKSERSCDLVAGGATTDGHATKLLTNQQTVATKNRNGPNVVCYVCSKDCPTSLARFIYALKFSDDEPYFPFILGLRGPAGAMPLTKNGLTQVCSDCRKSLSRQWKIFESRKVAENERIYKINDFPIVTDKYQRKEINLRREKDVDGHVIENDGSRSCCYVCGEFAPLPRLHVLNIAEAEGAGKEGDNERDRLDNTALPFVKLLSCQNNDKRLSDDKEGKIVVCSSCFNRIPNDWKELKERNVAGEEREFVLKRPVMPSQFISNGDKERKNGEGEECLSQVRSTFGELEKTESIASSSEDLVNILYRRNLKSNDQIMINETKKSNIDVSMSLPYSSPFSDSSVSSPRSTKTDCNKNMTTSLSAHPHHPPPPPHHHPLPVNHLDDVVTRDQEVINCFLCGTKCEKDKENARNGLVTINAHPKLDANHEKDNKTFFSHPFFPFLMKLIPASSATPSSSSSAAAAAADVLLQHGAVEVCYVCYLNIFNQWKRYEASEEVPNRWSRAYAYDSFECGTCGRSAKRDEMQLVTSADSQCPKQKNKKKKKTKNKNREDVEYSLICLRCYNQLRLNTDETKRSKSILRSNEVEELNGIELKNKKLEKEEIEREEKTSSFDRNKQQVVPISSPWLVCSSNNSEHLFHRGGGRGGDESGGGGGGSSYLEALKKLANDSTNGPFSSSSSSFCLSNNFGFKATLERKSKSESKTTSIVKNNSELNVKDKIILECDQNPHLSSDGIVVCSSNVSDSVKDYGQRDRLASHVTSEKANGFSHQSTNFLISSPSTSLAFNNLSNHKSKVSRSLSQVQRVASLIPSKISRDEKAETEDEEEEEEEEARFVRNGFSINRDSSMIHSSDSISNLAIYSAYLSQLSSNNNILRYPSPRFPWTDSDKSVALQQDLQQQQQQMMINYSSYPYNHLFNVPYLHPFFPSASPFQYGVGGEGAGGAIIPTNPYFGLSSMVPQPAQRMYGDSSDWSTASRDRQKKLQSSDDETKSVTREQEVDERSSRTKDNKEREKNENVDRSFRTKLDDDHSNDGRYRSVCRKRIRRRSNYRRDDRVIDKPNYHRPFLDDGMPSSGDEEEDRTEDVVKRRKLSQNDFNVNDELIKSGFGSKCCDLRSNENHLDIIDDKNHLGDRVPVPQCLDSPKANDGLRLNGRHENSGSCCHNDGLGLNGCHDNGGCCHDDSLGLNGCRDSGGCYHDDSQRSNGCHDSNDECKDERLNAALGLISLRTSVVSPKGNKRSKIEEDSNQETETNCKMLHSDLSYSTIESKKMERQRDISNNESRFLNPSLKILSSSSLSSFGVQDNKGHQQKRDERKEEIVDGPNLMKLQWPGIEAIIESYQQYFQEYNSEKSFLSNQNKRLSSRNEDLVSIATKHENKIMELSLNKGCLENERSELQSTITKITSCLQEMKQKTKL